MKPLSSRDKARATRILNLKKVRSFIISNPGATSTQIYETTGHGVMDLQYKGLAYWKREDGVVKWYAKAGLAYPSVAKSQKEWDQEMERTWERYTG